MADGREAKMSGDLRVLAEKYVTLTGEIEDVRRAMLACLTNGAGDTPDAPFAQPARSPGGSQHPNAIAAKEAEAQIIGLLRATPGLRTVEIADLVGKCSATSLRRWCALASSEGFLGKVRRHPSYESSTNPKTLNYVIFVNSPVTRGKSPRPIAPSPAT
jgi:hypothetical protein